MTFARPLGYGTYDHFLDPADAPEDQESQFDEAEWPLTAPPAQTITFLGIGRRSL